MDPHFIRQEELAALEILKQTGTNVLEAALIAKEALEQNRGQIKRARACIAAGTEALKLREKTVTFTQAVGAAVEARRTRRPRTQSDFRYLTQRLLRLCPGLAKRRVRSITPAECRAYLQQAFSTPRQRNKGRLALSGVFATARKCGWCGDNPMQQIEPEKVEENRIDILNHEEIERLLHTAREYGCGSCLPAVGLMLYAGIRPHEVTRLRWEDVHTERGMISISPRHSKTGGARHVTIHPPLARLLSRHGKRHGSICPPNWRKHWAALHRRAGFAHWQQDVLRHTFATHHLAAFRSYSELQVEMGHRSAELLRCRYVGMNPGMRGRSLLD